MDWIHLARDMDQQMFMNTEMKLHLILRTVHVNSCSWRRCESNFVTNT
jgi:hypothetical protein